MSDCEAFIVEQEEAPQEILQYLHDLLLSFPGMTSKIRYKIPFYYCRSWICYLNPVKEEKVELVFTRGNELSNEQGLLQANGRKQVRGILFENTETVDENVLLEIIQEALTLDESIPYASKNRKK